MVGVEGADEGVVRRSVVENSTRQAFIESFDKRMADLGDLAIGFDATQVPDPKKAFTL